MEKINLLPVKGNYYKANLHCHTTSSDGQWTPEEVKKNYMEHGYSIVAITDHNCYYNHVELNDDQFLALAAYEVEINEFVNRGQTFSRVKTYHINLFHTDPKRWSGKEHPPKPLQRYGDIPYINQYIAQMNELGFLVCYNHPYWSLQNYDDYKDLKGLWGMEIYNYGCEKDGLYGYHPQSYDEMLRSGQRIFCLATDDNHNKFSIDHPLSDSFGGFTMIYGTDLSYQTIINSLEKGYFYSSMGPEIYEMSLTGNHLRIRTSPVEYIYVVTEGRNCFRAAASCGQTITEAEFIIDGDEGYLRLDIRDRNGRHANTNAYYLNEINKYC